MKPIALIDMDGTLCDFDGSMTRDLQVLKGPEEPDLLAEETYAHIKARKNIIKHQPDWWLNLALLRRGLRLYTILEQLGFKIVVLTRGPNNCPEAWTQKFKWCAKYVPRAKVTITNDDKARVDGLVLVDDWIPYVEPWAKAHPRGLVIMPDQPWNRIRGHKHYVHPQVLRCDENYDEIRHRLIDLLEESCTDQ